MHAPAPDTPVDLPRLVLALADHGPAATSTAAAAAVDAAWARSIIDGVRVVLKVAIVVVDGEGANMAILVIVPAAVARVRVVITTESLFFAGRGSCARGKLSVGGEASHENSTAVLTGRFPQVVGRRQGPGTRAKYCMYMGVIQQYLTRAVTPGMYVDYT